MINSKWAPFDIQPGKHHRVQLPVIKNPEYGWGSQQTDSHHKEPNLYIMDYTQGKNQKGKDHQPSQSLLTRVGTPVLVQPPDEPRMAKLWVLTVLPLKVSQLVISLTSIYTSIRCVWTHRQWCPIAWLTSAIVQQGIKYQNVIIIWKAHISMMKVEVNSGFVEEISNTNTHLLHTMLPWKLLTKLWKTCFQIFRVIYHRK